VSTADSARGVEDQSSGKFTLHHLFGRQAASPYLDAAINHQAHKKQSSGVKTRGDFGGVYARVETPAYLLDLSGHVDFAILMPRLKPIPSRPR
jgi:hypothetical protein